MFLRLADKEHLFRPIKQEVSTPIKANSSRARDTRSSDNFHAKTMADQVQYLMEKMIPELEDLQVLQIFDKVHG
jgi:hypothetical protein